MKIRVIFSPRVLFTQIHVTAVCRWETHNINIEDGIGLVRDRRTGRMVMPWVEELEVILGFEVGDTVVPEMVSLPAFASDIVRWGALGNCIDANALTYPLEPRTNGFL